MGVEVDRGVLAPSAAQAKADSAGAAAAAGVRPAAKKKKRSALKRVILEEREVRNDDPVGSKPPAAAHVDPGVPPEVPEFIPFGWIMPGAEAAASPTDEPRGGVLDASAAVPPAEFVPSWCKPGSGEAEADATAEGAAPAQPLDELPVGEAIERMDALRQAGSEKQKKKKEKSEKTPAKGANIEVRHYVHQVLSDDLDEKVKLMLGELARFQERAKEKDPMKFAKLKRLCYGLREAGRSVTRGKAKCLIIAPNLEESSLEGGLDDTVEELIELCRENDVPTIFALSRNRIGKALGKNIRLSIVCLLSVEGVHKEFREVIKSVDDLRRQWVVRQMEQMSMISEEEADEERRKVEELAAKLAARRAEKARLEAERKAEEEQKRLEDKERRAAEKAVKQAERNKRLAEQKEEREKKRAEMEIEKEKQDKIDEEKRAEEARIASAKAAEALKAERARKQAEQKAEMERNRRIQEEAKRRLEERAAAIASGTIAVEEEEESSDDDELPAGFSATLF